MSHRISLSAAAVLVALLASPAFAMDIVHIPDSSTPNNGAPPDGLFDNSIPDTWQKKSDITDDGQTNAGSGSGFHFSVTNNTSQTQTPSSAWGSSQTPGSEFYQPMPGFDPYLPH